MLRLRNGVHRCGTCGHEVPGPELPDMSYGEFLLWSDVGEVRYLNALEDHTYDDWLSLIRSMASWLAMESEAVLELARKGYGPAVCDPDSHGNPFRLDLLPCPKGCGDMLNWTPVDDWVEVSPVTHARWNHLTPEAKRAAAETSLD